MSPSAKIRPYPGMYPDQADTVAQQTRQQADKAADIAWDYQYRCPKCEGIFSGRVDFLKHECPALRKLQPVEVEVRQRDFRSICVIDKIVKLKEQICKGSPHKHKWPVSLTG